MSLLFVIGIQLLVVGVVLVAATPTIRRRWPGGDAALTIARTGALVFGIVLVAADLSGTATPMSRTPNPVAGTVTSIDAGRAVYQATCAACHGVDGQGGGPQAGTTAVTPPSLTAHLSGHSDGDLFYWITNGLPGGMPAWGDRLSETDRWNLVNYLRAINGRAPVSDLGAARVALLLPLGFGTFFGGWLLAGFRRGARRRR